MNPAIDDEILNILLEEGINLICSVPCIMLAGVLKKLESTSITHIPVTREEEGVGIAAGISLGGGKPALIMQNSGLGNSINALLSLTKLYGIPLPLIIIKRKQAVRIWLCIRVVVNMEACCLPTVEIPPVDIM